MQALLLLSLAEGLQAPDYTLSRYPDVAGTVPAKLYGKPQATAQVKAAERILEWEKAESSTS